MGQFKRARLTGSDELFRRTRPDAEGQVEAAPVEPVTETLSVELSVADIEAIVDALELARFPERQRSRPLSQEFERLRELQDRLRRLIAE